MKKIVYIIFFFVFGSIAFAGNIDKEKVSAKVISGKVTDAYGEVIAGAQVTIAETGETFFSDFEGNFSFSIKTDKEYSLTINTLGYEPLQVKSSCLSAFSDLSLKAL